MSEGRKLAIATYVDNNFTVATTGNAAVSMMNRVEVTLKTRWDLNIKEDSREYLIPRGSPHTTSDQRYARVVQLRALGHVISDDAGCREDWSQARGKMWKSFFRTCSGKTVKSLPFAAKCKLSNKVVGPILDFHNSRWSATPNLLFEVDRVQRRMMASLLGLRKSAEEAPEGFVRRRARHAGQCVAKAGLWSHRCAKRVVAWEAHLRRPANKNSWASQLLMYRGREWLQERRAAQESPSIQAARTGTRVAAGKVQTRWHDGAVYAQSHIKCAGEAHQTATASKRGQYLEQAIARERARSL